MLTLWTIASSSNTIVRFYIVAFGALKLAARGDAVGIAAATARARCLAIFPTHLAERLVSLVLSHLVDALEGEGAGSG